MTALPAAQRRVLVVHADPERRERLSDALREGLGGVAVEAFESGTDAISALGRGEKEVLVIDGALMRADDSAALHRLRQDRALVNVYIVALETDIEHALDLFAGNDQPDDAVVELGDPRELVFRVDLGFARQASAEQKARESAELARLYQRQTEFLSVASHEIRTPLSAIMSAASILMRYGRQRPESVERFARVIHQECRRLTRLINDLLDLSKIESGQLNWQLEPVAPEALLEQVKESFAALVGEREIKLETMLGPGLDNVVVDLDKMIQVLTNLVSNAVKYSPDRGTVFLRCSADDIGGFRFEVEDQGPGIPPGAEDRIFERFQQLDVGDERTGTGLGLTIARYIVEHHGGRIYAQPGRLVGALLVVELPRREG
jgi:signal transduction histidine kinase